MSLIKADPTSNAARDTTDYAPEGGDSGKLGYAVVPYPPERPAQVNSDIATTKDNFAFKDPQDGTSAGAYLHQQEAYSAETGDDDGAFESEEGTTEDKRESEVSKKAK